MGNISEKGLLLNVALVLIPSWWTDHWVVEEARRFIRQGK